MILDDFSVQPFDAGSRALLLEIIEDRHGKRTTIITAQVTVKKMARGNRRKNTCRCNHGQNRSSINTNRTLWRLLKKKAKTR